MDDIYHPWDINASPEHASGNNPAPTAVSLLGKQLLLVSSHGLVEQAVHLLSHTLALCIALYIDNST